MLKQDVAQKLHEFDSQDFSSEEHELEQLKITLNKVLGKLEDYFPNEDTYAGFLISERWINLTNEVYGLLNYVDHDSERSPLEHYYDIIEKQVEIEREHIRQESF